MQPDKYLPHIQFEEKFCMACFWDGQDPETSYITHFLKVSKGPTAYPLCMCRTHANSDRAFHMPRVCVSPQQQILVFTSPRGSCGGAVGSPLIISNEHPSCLRRSTSVTSSV